MFLGIFIAVVVAFKDMVYMYIYFIMKYIDNLLQQ